LREEVDYTESVEAFKTEETVKLEPWGMSYDHLRLTIKGIPNTPYAGGSFMFEIKMGDNFPFAPPYCYCHTLLWHPNIDSSIPPGKINICLDLINPELVGCEPPFFNPGDPLNFEAGEQALHNYSKYENKAKDWTKKYAMN